MDDIKTIVVYVVGAIFTLLTPIHNFMVAMLILFGINFFIGIIAAVVNNEQWSFRKAFTFIEYVCIFLLLACSAFTIGHFMNNEEQAVAVVKMLCYLAVYIFGTNIFRNLRLIVPKGTAWHRLFDLCYYTLSVKFIEKFDFVKKWQEEKKQESGNAVLDHDNF